VEAAGAVAHEADISRRRRRRRRRRRSLVHGLLPKNSEKSVPKPKLIY
jgi:hypothetical protein